MAENTSVMQVIPKLVDFIEWIIPALDKFPKSRKFLLADRIETGLFSMLDKLIEANYSRDKVLTLRQANLQLEQIRYQIRIAYKLRCLDIRRYEFCANALMEIGKMIGGWIKSAGNKV
jgi:four helix bundle protein